MTGGVGVVPSLCDDPDRSRPTLGLPAGEGTVVGVVWSSRVATVRVRYGDGVDAPARIVSGRGFPRRLYAASLRFGRFAVGVAGYDARGRLVDRLRLDDATPGWTPGMEPASQVVTTDLSIGEPSTRSVVYWHGWDMCAAVLQVPKRVSDIGCVSGDPGWTDIVNHAVHTCGGIDGVLICGAEGATARVVLTLRDGTTVLGKPVAGYGFPLSVFTFAADHTEVARIDAYERNGSHVGGADLSPEDWR